MTNLLCFRWVNLQKDSSFTFFVTLLKLSSMLLASSQSSASKLTTTRYLYELVIHVVSLKKENQKNLSTPQMVKTLFSRNLGPFIYVSNTPDCTMGTCFTWSPLCRNSILSHTPSLFSNTTGKQSRDVAAIIIFFSI